ncbi:Ammonia transporter [Edwardsiella tarda]|nr:Ammonia transporter [Edwardsiella tarda]
MAGLWGVVALKQWLRVDDACDVFGVHGVCGIVGCLATGVLSTDALGGTGYASGVTMGHQVWVQALSVLVSVLWSAAAALIAYKVADRCVGLRVSEEQEHTGLDVTSHGESAYNR